MTTHQRDPEVTWLSVGFVHLAPTSLGRLARVRLGSMCFPWADKIDTPPPWRLRCCRGFMVGYPSRDSLGCSFAMDRLTARRCHPGQALAMQTSAIGLSDYALALSRLF